MYIHSIHVFSKSNHPMWDYHSFSTWVARFQEVSWHFTTQGILQHIFWGALHNNIQYLEVVYLNLKIWIMLLGVNANEAQGWVWGRATPRRRPGADAPLAPIPEMRWPTHESTGHRHRPPKNEDSCRFFLTKYRWSCNGQVWISWSSQEVLSRTYLQWKFSWRSSLRRWILSTLSRRKSEDKNEIWGEARRVNFYSKIELEITLQGTTDHYRSPTSRHVCIDDFSFPKDMLVPWRADIFFRVA